MKCDICKGRTVVRSGQKYHYTESGLDNVYLENIDLRACEKCGDESPIIPRVLDVHVTIARAVALQQSRLRGADIKFLRKQLGMRAREWAVLLRVDVATFSRWENDEQQIGPQSDALIRYLYFRLAEERDGRRVPGNIVESIASVKHDRKAAAVISINVNNVDVFSYESTGKAAIATANAKILEESARTIHKEQVFLASSFVMANTISSSGSEYNLSVLFQSEYDQSLGTKGYINDMDSIFVEEKKNASLALAA